MYHLFYTLESSAMCCHAALEEADAAYELHSVDLLSTLPPEYLALNPNGKVPTLIHERDDGERLVLFQSGGILLYLADCHPEANLAPPPGSSGRGLCYQWLAFLGEMVQQSYMMSYYPDRFTSDSRGTAAVDEKGREWVGKLLGQVDRPSIPAPTSSATNSAFATSTSTPCRAGVPPTVPLSTASPTLPAAPPWSTSARRSNA